jgi:hypothetical protein
MKLIKKDMMKTKWNDETAENLSAPDAFIQLQGENLSFEKLLGIDTSNGECMHTQDNPINSIQAEYDLGFEQVTLHLGNYGHIHLTQKEFKKFLDGLNWLHQRMIKINECTTTKYNKKTKKHIVQKLNGNYWLPERKRIKRDK